MALDRSSLKIFAKIAVKACETVLTGIRMLGECYGSAAGGTGPLGTERRPLPNDLGSAAGLPPLRDWHDDDRQTSRSPVKFEGEDAQEADSVQPIGFGARAPLVTKMVVGSTTWLITPRNVRSRCNPMPPASNGSERPRPEVDRGLQMHLDGRGKVRSRGHHDLFSRLTAQLIGLHRVNYLEETAFGIVGEVTARKRLVSAFC